MSKWHTGWPLTTFYLATEWLTFLTPASSPPGSQGRQLTWMHLSVRGLLQLVQRCSCRQYTDDQRRVSSSNGHCLDTRAAGMLWKEDVLWKMISKTQLRVPLGVGLVARMPRGGALCESHFSVSQACLHL